MKDQPKLYLIPVSISSFQAQITIPEVVRNTIGGLEYFVVENERTARRFISSLNLGLDISKLNFRVLDKHTDPAAIDEILRPLTNGHSVGVMSESGCPGVADPGNLAVRYAHLHQFRVIPLPGPSSILMALMGSGLNGQQFRFNGYLPIQEKELRQHIHGIETESQTRNETQILIEAP